MTLRTSFYQNFIDIAENQWDIAQKQRNKLPELQAAFSSLEEKDAALDFYSTNIEPIQAAIDSSACIVIVSCALSAEGYIYDYAARNLSDNFAGVIDKLDIVGKWLVIPRLITGKDFPKDSRAYQRLKQLVSDRNYLAHPKSAPTLSYNEKTKDFEISGKAQRMQDFSNSLFNKAQNAIKALDELAITIERLDENEFASFFRLVRL